MKLSENLDRAYDEGFKTATLKFKPELDGCEFQVTELEKKITGKNAVISEQNDTIELQELKILTQGQKIKNRNIALLISIPLEAILFFIAGALIF